MIDERKRSGDMDERRDLLSNLINANEESLKDGEQRLSEDEIFGMGPGPGLWEHSLNDCRSGNMFILYFAGHEVRIIFQTRAAA